MKILLLADHMENGGAETHIYELSRHLSLLGHYVMVLSHGGTMANLLSTQGIPQKLYGASPLLTLAKLIRREKPNVVHAHTRKSAFLCRILLSFMSFPFVFTAHACFSAEPFKRSLSFFPHRTIAVSKDIAEHLTQNFGVSPQNISILQNGIDVDKFCPKRDKIKGINITTISRLDDDCALTASLLCHIAPILSRRIDDLQITIVGGGSQFMTVKALAQKANNRCGKTVVKMAGAQQNVLPYLQSSTLFVGVSRAALEAMSCGIPTIISGNEGYLGIAEGKTLALAEKGNFCARGYQKPSSKRLFWDVLRLLSNDQLAVRAKSDALKQVKLYHDAKDMARHTQQVYQAAIHDTFRARKSDILLCGYYGYGNLGDELTLRAVCSRLFAEAEKGPSEDRKIPLPPRKPRIAVLSPKTKSYKGLLCVDRFSPKALFYAMRHTGLFVLGGGSLLQNKTSNRSLFYYLSLLEVAHFLGIPTMLYASGIGPIHGKLPLFLCQRVLRKTDLITVRDTASLAFLKQMGIGNHLFLSADPVLFCKTHSAKSKGYVLVFVRAQEVELFSRLLKKIDKPIGLSLMDRQKDLAATKKLAQRLLRQGKEVIACKDLSPRGVIDAIGGADLVVSARLHALVLSFCMNVPFLGLSDDPKITAFSKAAYGSDAFGMTRDDLAARFRQSRKKMLALATPDALRALRLAGFPFDRDKKATRKIQN